MLLYLCPHAVLCCFGLASPAFSGAGKIDIIVVHRDNAKPSVQYAYLVVCVQDCNALSCYL